MSTTPVTFDLSAHDITVTEVHHNLSPSAIYELQHHIFRS
jgi:hypothetical protein